MLIHFRLEQQGRFNHQGLGGRGGLGKAGLSEQVDSRMDQRLQALPFNLAGKHTFGDGWSRNITFGVQDACTPPVHKTFHHLRVTQHLLSMLVRAADQASHGTQKVARGRFPSGDGSSQSQDRQCQLSQRSWSTWFHRDHL